MTELLITAAAFCPHLLPMQTIKMNKIDEALLPLFNEQSIEDHGGGGAQ